MMPRVLHYIDTIGPGGAETVFLQVADGLRRRGWDGRTALTGPGWVLDSVRRLELPVDVLPTRGRLDIGLLLGLRGIVRRHGIDLIHAHMFSPAVYAGAVGLWTGTPVVTTLHGASDTWRGGWGRRLRFRLVETAATAVCVSDALRDSLVADAGFHRDGVHVIHNGVDTDAFAAAHGAELRRRFGIPDETVLVGALGNLRPAKDFPTLLRAAAELAPDGRFAFAVAGQRTEPLYGELLALRDELGLTDRVAFWGFQEDPAAVLAAFDVLAISSSTEGFSLAAIQAMAAGTPVVATRSGGPEGIITDGEDGLLVPTESPAALAGAIRRVVDDPALRGRLVAAAERTAAQRFSLDAMLDGYEAVYRKLLGRGPTGPAPAAST